MAGDTARAAWLLVGEQFFEFRLSCTESQGRIDPPQGPGVAKCDASAECDTKCCEQFRDVEAGRGRGGG